MRILELGSGCGLLGMAIAATTPHEVVLTDPGIDVNLSEEVSCNTLSLLQRNVDLNQQELGSRASVQQLLWGDEADIAHLLERCGRFDLVIGSDVLYNPDVYHHLLRTILAFCGSTVPAILG